MLERAFHNPGESVEPKLSYFPKTFEASVIDQHRKLSDEIKSLVGLKG